MDSIFKTYKIPSYFIENRESFIMAFLGCLLDHIHDYAAQHKETPEDDTRVRVLFEQLSELAKAYNTIIKSWHDPVGTFSDALEGIQDATAFHKVQNVMNEIIERLKAPYYSAFNIEFEGNIPQEYSKYLPKFDGLILIRAVVY